MDTFPLTLALVAVALAIVALSMSRSDGGGDRVTCVTKGATLYSTTHDHGLHLTFWCEKQGEVVP